MIRLIEARISGIFNVTGPAQRLTFGELLTTAKTALASDVAYHHASDDFLRAQDLGEFMELPLWVNSELAESFMTFSIERALAAGLQFRPLAETIRDTFEWSKSALPRDCGNGRAADGQRTGAAGGADRLEYARILNRHGQAHIRQIELKQGGACPSVAIDRSPLK